MRPEIVGEISTHQWGCVYDENGIAPTLQYVHYKSPVLIMVDMKDKMQVIGSVDDHHKGIVYGKDGIAPTLLSSSYKDAIKVMENEIPYPANNKEGYIMVKEGDGVVATRPDKCGKSVQEGISPALNTFCGCGSGVVVKWPCDKNRGNSEGYQVAVEGDGLVMMRPQSSGKTVQKQLSPTLKCHNGCGSGVVIKEVLTRKRTEYGKMVRKQYENGQIEVSRNDMTELEPRGDGLSNTITTIKKDNMLIEGKFMDTNVNQAATVYNPEGVSPVVLASSNATGSKIKIVDEKNNETELAEGDVAAMHTPGRLKKDQNGPRFNDGESAFTVTAADKDGVAQNDNGQLRIRYLTPRECLRLQAFPDDAIDKLMAVESKSQCYKLAGNSIAVCCLKAIFKGIYVDKTFGKGGRQVSLNRWF